jgi:hypothetical protein
MTTRTTRTRPRAAAVLVAGCALGATLLAGCGSDDAAPASSATDPASSDPAPSTTETPTGPASAPTSVATSAPPTGPDCASVWTAGGTIPRGYQGCVADGALVKADKLGCESGQAIIRYADRFYGVAGGTIHEGTSPLIDDSDYAEMVAGCRA